MNDDGELYYTDERQSEKIIAEAELNMGKETIANRAFNEGFFTTCSVVNEEKYEEGFKAGKEYSIEFGKLFGLIDALLFYFLEINHEEDKQFKAIDEVDLTRIKEVKGYLEQYKEEINQTFIDEKQSEINSIMSKYV